MTMDKDFHVGRGRLPSHEQGLSGRVRVSRGADGKLVGSFSLETARGPIQFQASLEGPRGLPMREAIKQIAPEMQLAGGRARTSLAGAWREGGVSDLSGAWREGGMSDPNETFMGSSNTPNPNVVNANPNTPRFDAAQRLYAQLLARNPKAMSAVRGVIARAQQGDRRAMMLWGAMCKLNTQAKAMDFTRSTPQERAAADSLYMRLARKDAAAAQELAAIMGRARQGDPHAAFAWKLLCVRQEEAKNATMMGAAIVLSPERVAELVRIVSEARWAAPPRYASVDSMPLPGAGVPYQGSVTPGGGGLMSQYLADKQAPSGPFSLTSTPKAVALKTSVTPVAKYTRAFIQGVG